MRFLVHCFLSLGEVPKPSHTSRIMNLQSHVLLSLLTILPLTHGYPAFDLNQVIVKSPEGYPSIQTGKWSYSIWVKKTADPNSPAGALCATGKHDSDRGELQLECHDDSNRPLYNPTRDLTVKIQQPDEGNPEVSGFNIWINWGYVSIWIDVTVFLFSIFPFLFLGQYLFADWSGETQRIDE